MQAPHFQCCHNYLKSICFQQRAWTRSWTNVHYLTDSCHSTAWSRCHMTRWVGSSHSSYHPTKFMALAPCESQDETFLICHVTTLSMFHVTLWVGSLILSHHPAKFGVHRPCKSGDITPLICHVIKSSMYHVTL